jgi:histidinol-phosphate/aromatic aminotransferase/cobyric acid decarboxylase-like protein
MNFPDFQDRRRALLHQRPQLVDAAETNLYRSLHTLIPPKAPPASARVHRCHLAAQWLELYGLPSDASRRALVTCGVRDSLATIFTHCATKGCRLWLPEDCYPVYHALASDAGLATCTFCTLPEPVWPDDAPGEGDEMLVVSNPLKPRGRWLSAADVEALRRWLAASARRRIILDVVYSLGVTFHPTIGALLETDQVILLHSLTKGWLHPRLFGIALLPEQDATIWMPLFRAKTTPEESLASARQLLSEHANMPARVAIALEAAGQRMGLMLPDIIAKSLPVDAPGYFFPVTVSWQELLNQGVLGLPASTFGSKNEGITIVSSLSFHQ